MSLPRSISVLASAAALFSLAAVAGCTAGSTSAPVGATTTTGTPTGENAQCQSPGTHGIANYSFGGPCGISGPTMPGSIQILAHVQVDPHRQLSLQATDMSAQLGGSYDQCSCQPDTTATPGSPATYGSYAVCDPSMDSNAANVAPCTANFDNTVTGSVNATKDGTVTLQLLDGTSVLEEFSFEVASPASIDVKATLGTIGSPVIAPDANGVYQVHVSDQAVILTAHLLTADGRPLVVGGGRAALSARFSDSRVLGLDQVKVSGGQIGILLAGPGDGSVTLTDGAKLTRVLKFHVSG